MSYSQEKYIIFQGRKIFKTMMLEMGTKFHPDTVNTSYPHRYITVTLGIYEFSIAVGSVGIDKNTKETNSRWKNYIFIVGVGIIHCSLSLGRYPLISSSTSFLSIHVALLHRFLLLLLLFSLTCI